MKIAICGSMSFAKEMIDLKKDLEKKGHKVIIPDEAEKHLGGKITEQDKWEKLKFNVFKKYFNEIKNSDAIVVININKNNVKGYIGGNSLIEMAFAHVLDKKIFLTCEIPKIAYSQEIKAMKPIVLRKDLGNLKN